MVKIATTVYNVETIELQDGKEVTLRPLAIGRLRRFMKVWEGFKELDADDEEASLNIFVNCAGIAIEDSFKDVFEKTHDSDGLTKEYYEHLEEVLDMDTIYKILDVCGGLKLNDPNLIAAAAKAAAEAGGN